MKIGNLHIKTEKTLNEEVEQIVEGSLNKLDHRMLNRMIEDLEWEKISPTQKGMSRSDLSIESREKLVAEAIKMWIKDPMVGNAVDLYTYFVFGRGLPKPRCDFGKAQEIIDEFWDDEENKLVLTSTEAQIMKSNELQLQGNIWLTVFADENSHRVKLSDIPDDEIKDVIPHPENRKRHLFYKRVSTKNEYDFAKGEWKAPTGKDETKYYPDWKNWPLGDDETSLDNEPTAEKTGEGKVFHLAINRLSDAKFGNPRVTRIIKWAHAFNEFQTARVRLMQAAAWLAWRQKIQGDQTKVDRMAAQSYSMTPGQDGVPVPSPPQYAAMLTENQGVHTEFIKTDTGGANAKSDGNMLKGTIATGVGMGTHFFGESETNLATATSLELPVLKMCETGQEYWIGAFTELIDFVLERAVKMGKLPKPSHGKFSDIESTGTTAAEGKITEAFPEGPMREALLEKFGGEDVDITRLSGDVIYHYDLELPNIIQRQITETINSIVNVLTSFDPNGTNDELTRWAFDQILLTFGEKNTAEILAKVFPKGKPIDRQPTTTAVRNKFVKSTGDPYQTTQERTGAPTQARTPEEIDKSLEADMSPELTQLVNQFAVINDEILADLEQRLLAQVGGNNGDRATTGTT